MFEVGPQVLNNCCLDYKILLTQHTYVEELSFFKRRPSSSRSFGFRHPRRVPHPFMLCVFDIGNLTSISVTRWRSNVPVSLYKTQLSWVNWLSYKKPIYRFPLSPQPPRSRVPSPFLAPPASRFPLNLLTDMQSGSRGGNRKASFGI